VSLNTAALAQHLARGVEAAPGEQLEPRVSVARQDFVIPDREGLPSLDRYAYLRLPNGDRRTAGYVEASRGCKHRCRHCPVVHVYNGRFRIVPREIVLADVRQQAAAGARHISFGDPDFFNGPTHAHRIVEAVREEFPELTYDVTIEVEKRRLCIRGRTPTPKWTSSKCRFRPWCNGREPRRMISSSAKYGDLLTITPGVLPRPCLPWEPGARRLSLASHGIVARNRPRSSLPFFSPRVA